MNKIKTKVVDTNVILRFLVGDNKKQLKQAKDWFRQAQQDKINLIILPLVIAEACYVLESFYQVERGEIAQKMQVLISQRWLKVQQRQVLISLWPFYLEGLYFVDSYLLSWTKVNHQAVLSFDQEVKN